MTKYSIKFYKGIKKFMNFTLHILYIPKINGLENIPKHTPYILAGNHKSLLDIPLVACSTSQPIRFMAKKELFSSKISEWLFYKLGAFPVDRKKANLKVLKTAITILNNEEVLGIFPEGTRSKGEIQPFKAGTTVISKKTQAPIIPFGISGEYKFRKKIYLTFGKPIDISTIDENPEKYLQEQVKKLVIR